MSAMPARTGLSDTAHTAAGAPSVQTQRRAERRAQERVARRARRRRAVVGCSILAGAFGVTVGILDVLH
jgi:hypothetical protein